MWRLGFAVGLMLSLLLVSCKGQDNFIQSAASEFFTVDYNPDYLDVLWVVDDRSPMNDARAHLLTQARAFFERLDASTAQYRMAIISADSEYAKGRLKPDGGGVIFTKNYGTVEQRSQSFGTIFSQVINLHTGAEANGLAASLMALESTFVPIAGVPLVVVYLSDGDDHTTINGQDAVDYYSEELLKIKGGKKDLLRVYSFNLKELNGAPKTTTNRCTTLDQAEIDVLSHNGASQPTFEDRYFRLADKLGGEKSDLCGPFASLVSLEGLRLKELPNRFQLKSQPKPSSIQVSIFRGDESLTVPQWTYEVATNEIVFAQTPPAGTTIYVSFEQNK
jgi:hypothetical protein